MAVMDTDSAPTPPAGLVARLRSLLYSLLGGSGEASLTKRLAGTIFIIRVVSAAMAYLSQILLARWMGGSDYGVYVYVWTWVLLLGSMMDFGISASAQKIIPEYRTRGEQALLRGFLSGSRWMTLSVSAAVSLLLAGVVKLLSPWLSAGEIVPLYIGCATLPAFVTAPSTVKTWELPRTTISSPFSTGISAPARITTIATCGPAGPVGTPFFWMKAKFVGSSQAVLHLWKFTVHSRSLM